MAIHPTALIAADASLAPDVEVGAYSVIGAGVTIGAGTWIGPHVVIEGPSAIGRENRISRPQRGLVTDAREVHGECRSPAAGSEYGDVTNNRLLHQFPDTALADSPLGTRHKP